MLTSVGSSLLPAGAKFEEALREHEGACSRWRKQRRDARRKAAAAARAKADADAAAAGGSASGADDPTPGQPAGGAGSGAAAGGGGGSSRAQSREGDAKEDADEDEEEQEEENVLLGSTGSGGSVAVDEAGQPKPAPQPTDPALVPRKGRRRGAKGSADRVEAWFGAQVDVDISLGGGGHAPSDPAGGGTEAGEASAEAAAAGRAHAVETRAKEVAAAGGVFPSLFAVARLARAAARVRAAQLSASQSSVRALFSRFRGRMSAQADVLGEQAAHATESIATVQDAELADTLEVVRTCVALLGSFRLSQAGFVSRANAVLGLDADRAEGQDPFGPAGEARFRIKYPPEIVTLAERRAGARMGYLEERQRVLAGCWRGYTSRLGRRAAQCGHAAAGLVLDRVCSAGDRSAEEEVDSVLRLLLLTPRTPASMRGVSGPAAARLTAPRKPSLRVAAMPPAGPIPAQVAERLSADSAALPAPFAREWVLRCEAALASAEAEAAAARERVASIRRAHRRRFAGKRPGEADAAAAAEEGDDGDDDEEEEEEEGAGGSGALTRAASVSVSADAVVAAARAALAGLGSDVLAAAHAADKESDEAAEAAAEAAAAAGVASDGEAEASGSPSEEAVAAAAAASKRAREAAWRASAAWVAVGLCPADVLSAARAALEARLAHLGATAVVVQRWVRRWRQQRSTASEAMAELVAATISEFQRALDRELEILSARAKKAVARVEKHKGERWFLDALNGRLKDMNGDGVAEAVAASAAGPE
ncbi:hypothetical protein FNF27_03384 [Cafeteria roenbergensis]|uniref:Uncharacterized protein n=2 Tax=Cafeteria roenbergensis TaxID=33653 RepID=A0A5A8EB90_CAFRO|nr:hypothetical protein FNF27_03384 [Cafeteria roenbergensis]